MSNIVDPQTGLCGFFDFVCDPWPVYDTDFSFDLYAGAEQCHISNGTLVDELLVDINDSGMIDVNYNMFSGYGLDEARLWFDNESWPGNSISPGQFPPQSRRTEWERKAIPLVI